MWQKCISFWTYHLKNVFSHSLHKYWRRNICYIALNSIPSNKCSRTPSNTAGMPEQLWDNLCTICLRNNNNNNNSSNSINNNSNNNKNNSSSIYNNNNSSSSSSNNNNNNNKSIVMLCINHSSSSNNNNNKSIVMVRSVLYHAQTLSVCSNSQVPLQTRLFITNGPTPHPTLLSHMWTKCLKK